MTGLQSLTKGIGKFLRILEPYFGLFYEAILKRLQGPFEKKVGKLKYGSLAVVNSQSRKLKISWFPKNVEMAIRSYL